MKPGWIALAVAVPALLLAGFVLSDAQEPTPATTGTEPGVQATAMHREASAMATTARSPAVPLPTAASQATGLATLVPAAGTVIASLDARAAATAPPDPRVPPIDPPPADEPEHAQPWEVADPALYRAREQRLEREVDTRFVQATAARLPQLRAAVDEMRARGASQVDIARAEDKIAHMQAVQDALLRGEPLAASAPIEAVPGRP